MNPRLKRRLVLDLAIIVASVIAALWLVRAGVFNQTLVAAQEWGAFGCFVAGLLFTSVFTVGPASIGLAVLGESLPPLIVALWGALGALAGDLLLYRFLRSRVAPDVELAVTGATYRKTLSFFHLGFVRVLAPLLGALVIASPLPDELGLALMGISRTRIAIVAPISFVMNFLGILALVAAVRLW